MNTATLRRQVPVSPMFLYCSSIRYLYVKASSASVGYGQGIEGKVVWQVFSFDVLVARYPKQGDCNDVVAVVGFHYVARMEFQYVVCIESLVSVQILMLQPSR